MSHIIGDPWSQFMVYNRLLISVLTGVSACTYTPTAYFIYILCSTIYWLRCLWWRNGVHTSMLRTWNQEPLLKSCERRHLWSAKHRTAVSLFLSSPYKWAIPSTTAPAILYWLVSQLFIFARVDLYRCSSQSSGEIHSVERLYWSGLAVVIVICLGYGILFGLCEIGWQRHYPDIIPLSGCCSASITASCQNFGLLLRRMYSPELKPLSSFPLVLPDTWKSRHAKPVIFSPYVFRWEIETEPEYCQDKSGLSRKPPRVWGYLSPRGIHGEVEQPVRSGHVSASRRSNTATGWYFDWGAVLHRGALEWKCINWNTLTLRRREV